MDRVAMIRAWAGRWRLGVQRDVGTLFTTPMRITSVNPVALLLGPQALLCAVLIDAEFWLYADTYRLADLPSRLQSWGWTPGVLQVVLVLAFVYVVHVVAVVTLICLLAVALFGPRRRSAEAAILGVAASGAVAGVTAAARGVLWTLAAAFPSGLQISGDLQVTLYATRWPMFDVFLICLGLLAVAFPLATWRIRVPAALLDEPTAAATPTTLHRGDSAVPTTVATVAGDKHRDHAQSSTTLHGRG